MNDLLKLFGFNRFTTERNNEGFTTVLVDIGRRIPKPLHNQPL